MCMGVMEGKQNRRAKKTEKKREGKEIEGRGERMKGEFRMLLEVPPRL